MLLRGANAVGYTTYADNVVNAFVKESVSAPAVSVAWLCCGQVVAVWCSPARGCTASEARQTAANMPQRMLQ